MTSHLVPHAVKCSDFVEEVFLGGVSGGIYTLCLFVLVRNGSLCCVCFGHGEAVNIMSKTFEYLQISLLKYLEMYLMCSGWGGVSTRSMFGERGGGGGEYHE